jgi:Na+/melibiose symporter-like transporter
LSTRGYSGDKRKVRAGAGQYHPEAQRKIIMRIGASLVLIAIGAILKFAVHPGNSHGFDVGTAGVILMIVGAIGLVISVIWMMSRRRTDVVQQTGVDGTRTTYMSPNDPAY